jgi:hypothetical protein
MTNDKIQCTYCKAELADNEIFCSNQMNWKPICSVCVKSKKPEEK